MINSAQFFKSSQNIEQCPSDKRNEVAFIGRSNVGKSSLINALTERKKLAKVSSVPGKTQLINHFLINDSWYLVDLPGYGWAKVSKDLKAKWQQEINEYIVKRDQLYCLFVLIDSRLEPQKNDLLFMEWLNENKISFAIVFTKGDKLTTNKIASNVAKYRKVLKNRWSQIPPNFLTSATERQGLKEITDYIETFIHD